MLDKKDPVTRGLGWFSLALGTAQIATPRGVARMIRLRGDDEQAAVMRAVGVREILTGVGILARPKPSAWVWGRVAGDAMDLALLARADGNPGGKRFGMAAVAGVAVPDLIEGMRLAREDAGTPSAVEVVERDSITVRRPQEDVERSWREHMQAWDGARVTFTPAPGGRGTEIYVEVRFAPPLGDIGLAAAKLTGRSPATRLSDDLRRFKQLAETGEIVRSDATLEGHSLKSQLMQRPAQPIEGSAT